MKKRTLSKMHYKAGNESKQAGHGQNRTGKTETLGQKKKKIQVAILKGTKLPLKVHRLRKI